jgi:uncharacterized membrane protein
LPYLHTLLAIAHALASAAWFGSMFYSVTVLQPRAKLHFKTDAEFEDFAATLAHGARWKVLTAFALVGITGGLLILVVWPEPMTTLWVVLVSIKAILFFAALAVFCYASWWLWPRRIFASPAELPGIQRQFRIVGFTLLTLVGLAFMLGIAARFV